MGKKDFSTILSIIAIFIGIAAYFTNRPYEWNIDFVGVIVAVLSVLVTVLITWNIYSLIDTKSLGRDIKKIKEENISSTEEALAEAHMGILNQSSAFVEGRDEDDRAYNAISNGLLALKHYYVAGNKKQVLKIEKIIMDFKLDKCKLTTHQYMNIYMIIGQVENLGYNTENIKKWLEKTKANE